MRLAVIGAGAIGSLVAGYLKEKGLDLILLAKKDTLEKIKKQGLQISGVRGDFLISKIDVREKLDTEVSLVILATKMQDLERAILENQKYLKDSFILTTQNGIGAEEIVSKYIDKNKICSSIIMFGATYLETAKVIHNFEGKWLLGKPYDKDIDVLKNIKSILGKAFDVELVEDIISKKWLKVFLNANNCLPALLGESMQEVFSDLELCEIAIGIWQEGLKVIKNAGIKLSDIGDFSVDKLKSITSLPLKEATVIFSKIMMGLSKEPLYGSILQSIKRNRPSEIDYINGAFVELGRKSNFYTPLNKKVVEMVHKVEETKKFFSKEEVILKLKNLIPAYASNKETVNTPFPKLRLTVLKVEGDCYHGYKKDDQIILDDFTHPPKHFCLGLAHVLFPVIYALSFGARFPFQENMRSLEVTCPDGGKLTFKVEIFDREGNIENIPKDKEYKEPQPKELVIEVVKSDGSCFYGYKKGDKFELKGLKCPKDFCGTAFHTIFPALFALNFGAKFFFMDNPNSIDTVTCPDKGKVVFKVSRKDE
ncbi:MAG: 2-dehydropantoate 2-reductase [Candidatus Omnitrophica bacterium]|nr:2-dehydropantoate 2-reductase [Candidatus Omnitrophota bacterium]MCM8799744.1 2-dehydropantoate 2-reductase [Candidatus Omnitrophota bacterium]